MLRKKFLISETMINCVSIDLKYSHLNSRKKSRLFGEILVFNRRSNDAVNFSSATQQISMPVSVFLSLSVFLPDHVTSLIFCLLRASFFEQLDRLSSEDYIPTYTDLLRCRVTTLGIVSTEFDMEGVHIRYGFYHLHSYVCCFDVIRDGFIFVCLVVGYLTLEDSVLNEKNGSKLSKGSLLYSFLLPFQSMLFPPFFLFLHILTAVLFSRFLSSLLAFAVSTFFA